jgi:hypothetical protein
MKLQSKLLKDNNAVTSKQIKNQTKSVAAQINPYRKQSG